MNEYREHFSEISGLIDTHAHLSMLQPDGISVEEGIAQLFAAGFGGIIDVGTDANDLSRRTNRFSRFERVRFAAGVWPYPHAIADPNRPLAELEAQIAETPQSLLAAVGECGLDRHRNKPETGADIAGEQKLFEGQLDLAMRLNLPIIIHSREAPEETARILADHPGVRGVIHSFSYGIPEARDFLNLGYYLSFTGVLTYKNAQNLREAIAFAPPDRILLETDAPFLAPLPFRGKPAHPCMILETYQFASNLLNIPLETLKNRIARNTADLFWSTA
jgi:TatD DNase family protein